MDELPVQADDPSAHAQIDRCSACGGLFLEFFDGEPSAISRDLRERADVAATRGRDAPEQLACPDCEEPMVRRAYLGEGPELARCETCLAVFLAPHEVAALARLELAREPEPEASWLVRLLGWLPGVR
jgi:hypothetical protein